MVGSGDCGGMAARVVELLENDALRRRIVEGGLQKVQAFSMDTMVRNYEKLYGSVLVS